MNRRFPKRLFACGDEPEVLKINNSCKVTLFKVLEECAPDELEEVCNDSIFSDIMALRRNNVGYSGRLIHSMLCRQLVTKKQHELWFVFGRLPLRFSLQEFHAVTGLDCSGDPFDDDDLEQWEDDNGFWAGVLREQTKISILDIKKYHLEAVKKWKPEDRLRLVYLFVIAGFVLAKDERRSVTSGSNW